MMSSRLRVLQMAPFLWSGAGRVITALCVSQAATNEVMVVTSGSSRGLRDWKPYRRRLAEAGIDHARIDLFDRQPEVFWRGVAILQRLIDTWQPDVVHAHAGVPTCAATLCRGRGGRRLPIVSQVHSWAPGRPPWMNDMDFAGHRLADRVLCTAAAYESHLLAAGVARRRLIRIEWGLPPLDVAAVATPLASGRRVGCVGRIEPRKAQLDVVRAFAHVRRALPAATLELVGPTADPAYGQAVGREVSRLGLTDAVTLTGYVRNALARVRRWDLFVSLSRDEGQGIAVLEAMALGVPVAARIVPGIEDYLRPGINGFGLDGSAVSAGRQIVRALSDGKRSVIARRAKALVARRYAWARTVARIEAVYRSVLDAPHHP